MQTVSYLYDQFLKTHTVSNKTKGSSYRENYRITYTPLRMAKMDIDHNEARKSPVNSAMSEFLKRKRNI